MDLYDRKIRHNIWCMVIPKIYDPETYISLYNTCKYFRKLIQRYNYHLIGDEYRLSIFDYDTKDDIKSWSGNLLYSMSGQHMGRGQSPIFTLNKKEMYETLKEREECPYREKYSLYLLSLPYRGHIKRCRIPII